jgi:LSD1 subclass zinc finger protein
VEAGYDLKKAAPIEAVQRSVTPTLFIHGDADSFIPCRMMKNLFEAASCRKMCMLMPGAEHVMSVCVDPERYWAKVDTFLQTVSPDLSAVKTRLL